MALLGGSTSFVRYAVEGELPDNFFEFAAKQIAANSFRDIDDTADEYSIGWVSVQSMFDSEFAYASHAVADYIVLSLRVDERKVSPAVLKKFTLKEEERIKKERQLPRLNRQQRVDIKESTRQLLVRRAAPVPAVYDLCWNLADNTLLFFSTNGKAQELFERFFKDTFGLSIRMQVPFLAAGHLMDPEDADMLAELNQTVFI